MSEHPLGPIAGFHVRNPPADPFSDLHYISAVIPISDEEYRLRTQGPTDAERAEWKRQAEERKTAEAKQRVEYSKLRQTATGTLRKILTLHSPVGEGTSWFTCGECFDGGNMGDHVDWPCATAWLALEEQ
jgi:hypothetical protein